MLSWYFNTVRIPDFPHLDKLFTGVVLPAYARRYEITQWREENSLYHLTCNLCFKTYICDSRSVSQKKKHRKKERRCYTFQKRYFILHHNFLTNPKFTHLLSFLSRFTRIKCPVCSRCSSRTHLKNLDSQWITKWNITYFLSSSGLMKNKFVKWKDIRKKTYRTI